MTPAPSAPPADFSAAWVIVGGEAMGPAARRRINRRPAAPGDSRGPPAQERLADGVPSSNS